MESLQQNVDLTFMFKYLYDYDSSKNRAIYVLPDELQLNEEKIKLYFGEESSITWRRGNPLPNKLLTIYFKKEINYTLFPDEKAQEEKELQSIIKFFS